eukprot:11517959-Prorocentrum_lima.AAC.1
MCIRDSLSVEHVVIQSVERWGIFEVLLGCLLFGYLEVIVVSLVVPGRCDPFALGDCESIRATSGGSIRCESKVAKILRPGWGGLLVGFGRLIATTTSTTTHHHHHHH